MHRFSLHSNCFITFFLLLSFIVFVVVSRAIVITLCCFLKPPVTMVTKKTSYVARMRILTHKPNAMVLVTVMADWPTPQLNLGGPAVALLEMGSGNKATALRVQQNSVDLALPNPITCQGYYRELLKGAGISGRRGSGWAKRP